MKILSSVVLCLLLLGCSSPNPSSPTSLSDVGKILSGWHVIHRISSDKTVNGSLNAGFFLFAGGASGSLTTTNTVTFSWLGNDNDYRYATLPLGKIRVELDEKALNPIVKFRWNPSYCELSIDDSRCIVYAVIRVNSKQWPTKVNMP